MLDKLKDYIHRDRLENPFCFWTEFVAIPMAIAGATTVALMLEASPWTLVYSGFVIATTMMLLTSVIRNVIMWVVLNTFYLVLNLTGLVNSII